MLFPDFQQFSKLCFYSIHLFVIHNFFCCSLHEQQQSKQSNWWYCSFVRISRCSKICLLYFLAWNFKELYSIYSSMCTKEDFQLLFVSLGQCCGSKYIEFGSGSRILAQFGSGSGYRVILSILKEKIQNNFRENNFL